MAKRETNPSEQLQELISERQRYEGWLNSLHARRDAAPAHVVARVEEDYRKRLAKISDELSARAGELRERVTSLSTRLSEIKLREGVLRDEKAEAEVRTAVGELSPGQWSEISERVDAELSTHEADRQVLERDLHDLERVLHGVTGELPASGAVAAADATRVAPAQPAQRPSTAAAPDARPVPRPAPVPHKVAPPAADARPPAPQAQAPAPAQAAARPQPAPPAERKQSSDPGAQKRTDASQREGQEKTLLCGECGTANYPTEWYCEACGAELSTL